MPIPFRNDLTAEYVRTRFDCDYELGILYYLDHPDLFYRQDLIGQPAGKGRQIEINKVPYVTARIIYLHRYGVWPDEEVDHKDRDDTNNSISNLRPATHTQNGRNKGIRNDNVSGHIGVSWHSKRNKWCVVVSRIEIGFFDDYDAACAAADFAKLKYHGKFAGVGQ